MKPGVVPVTLWASLEWVMSAPTHLLGAQTLLVEESSGVWVPVLWDPQLSAVECAFVNWTPLFASGSLLEIRRWGGSYCESCMRGARASTGHSAR